MYLSYSKIVLYYIVLYYYNEPVREISNNVVCAPAKPQISLRICAVWSEPLLVAWVFYDCKAK